MCQQHRNAGLVPCTNVLVLRVLSVLGQIQHAVWLNSVQFRPRGLRRLTGRVSLRRGSTRQSSGTKTRGHFQRATRRGCNVNYNKSWNWPERVNNRRWNAFSMPSNQLMQARGRGGGGTRSCVEGRGGTISMRQISYWVVTWSRCWCFSTYYHNWVVVVE